MRDKVYLCGVGEKAHEPINALLQSIYSKGYLLFITAAHKYEIHTIYFTCSVYFSHVRAALGEILVCEIKDIAFHYPI